MYGNIWLRTLVHKESKRVFRIWKQTLLPPIVTTFLYFLIFGKFIGSQIGSVSGVSYIQFLIPGFIMMSIITASYANVASSFFGAKFQRNIEEVITSPMSHTQIILWFISGGMIRGGVIATLVLIVASFFTPLQAHSIGGILFFIIFTCSLFSLAGFFNAFFAKTFDDVNLIPTFIITPLVYLWWVFYPISSLSGIWKFFTQINPITYMIDGLRYSFLWIESHSIWISGSALWVANILLFGACLYLFKKWYGLKN